MSVEAERETLERKDRDELQKIAGALGGKVTSRTRKADIIEQILELTGVTDGASGDGGTDASASGADGKPGESSAPGAKDQPEEKKSAGSKSPDPRSPETKSEKKGDAQEKAPAEKKDDSSGQSNGNAGGNGDDGEGGRRRRRRGRNRDGGPPQDEFTGEPIPVVGCLDLRDDGYGFLRVDGLLPSKDDCYVSVKQVRQFGLRKGDIVAGGSRPAFRNEKNPAILRIDTVNDVQLEPGTDRPLFQELTAVFPGERVDLVVEDDAESSTGRALDLLAPIGKGSRVLVAAPRRTGTTTLLENIVRSVEANEPDLAVVVVLLDERPEEITEMTRLVSAGTVHGSPVDADPEDHVAVLELALARAQRMAEAGDDVLFVVDGLTRLARADHASGHGGNQGSSKVLGGIEVSALSTAKRAFAAGRNLEEAGSLTVIATALAETGSEVDEAVLDAVAGAATTQIRLDRAAAERRSFPALDVGRTSTRREELLVGDEGAEKRESLRRMLSAKPDHVDAASDDGLDTLLRRLRDTPSNDELLEAVAKEEKSR